jgi:hypothetical protein
MHSSFQFWITLAVFLGSLGLIVYLSILERRPRKSLKTRLISSSTLIIVFGFVALVALVHLANLYGIHTGRR